MGLVTDIKLKVDLETPSMKSLLRTSGQQRTSGDSLTFSDPREIAKAISEPLSRGEGATGMRLGLVKIPLP